MPIGIKILSPCILITCLNEWPKRFSLVQSMSFGLPRRLIFHCISQCPYLCHLGKVMQHTHNVIDG